MEQGTSSDDRRSDEDQSSVQQPPRKGVPRSMRGRQRTTTPDRPIPLTPSPTGRDSPPERPGSHSPGPSDIPPPPRPLSPTFSRGGIRYHQRVNRRHGRPWQRREQLPPSSDPNVAAMEAHLQEEVQNIEESFQKQGHSGREIPLVTNHFRVIQTPGWSLHQYGVNLESEEVNHDIQRSQIRAHKDTLGPYVFDKGFVYCCIRLLGEDENGIVTLTTTKNDGSVVVTKLKHFQSMTKFEDRIYLQLYNLIVRKCLFGMGLEEIGRNFHDQAMLVDFPHLRIELWPGYDASMMDYEEQTLLCVEVTHKVVRKDSVLRVMESLLDANVMNIEQNIRNTLIDSIVMTNYNNVTYKITAVDFISTPLSTFPTRKGDMSFLTYYKQKYDREIRALDQPLLIAKPTKKERYRRGQKPTGPVVLIPELCVFTGLTDAMRGNFRLMKELSKHLHMSPVDRVRAINRFMTRLQGTGQLVEDLQQWGFQFDTSLVQCTGRVLNNESIIFARGAEVRDHKTDWTSAFRSNKLLQAEPLDWWIILVTRRDAEAGVDNLVRTMQKVAYPLGFDIRPPKEVIVLPDPKMQTFIRKIDEIVHKLAIDKRQLQLQMLFVILPTSSSDMYAAIKKRTLVDFGIPSQCFLAKNLRAKGLMSIATKMVVQMCTKLDGQPWTVKLPLKGLMVVGLYTYGHKGCQVTAMVASITPNFTKYFSTISTSISKGETTKNICNDLAKCIQTFKLHNGKLPEKIILYKDVGSDGEPDSIQTFEVEQLIAGIEETYNEEEVAEPKFTYITLSKKTNTRILARLPNERVENVPPGTILDNTITVPNRYDFYLVSATTRQGTVSPCYYNVHFDTSGLEPDKMQLLTYKMCHLYFNWSGTVSVPAPVQYAHKLATLTAVTYERAAHRNLEELLYYL